jgi:hypothetical protein
LFQCHHHPSPNPIPQLATLAPQKPTVTATSKTARPKKPQSKAAADPKPAAVNPKKKAGASAKSAAAKSTTPKLVVPTQSSTFPLEEISDLLDLLPIQACVELIRRLLTSVSSLPQGQPARGLSRRPSFFCGRIWQHALEGRRGVNPCASPAGMRTEFAAGSSNWSIFSASKVSIFVS